MIAQSKLNFIQAKGSGFIEPPLHKITGSSLFHPLNSLNDIILWVSWRRAKRKGNPTIYDYLPNPNIWIGLPSYNSVLLPKNKDLVNQLFINGLLVWTKMDI